MVAKVDDEVLRDVQQLIRFIVLHLHPIPRMQRDTAEYEGSLNLTIGP